MSNIRYLQLMAGAALIALAMPATAHDLGDLIPGSKVGSVQSAASGIAVQPQQTYQEARRGRGADDPAGDDRGGRGRGKGGHGADDGPNHASSSSELPFLLARHGADDAAGDDRGGKGRKGGRDDGAGHA